MDFEQAAASSATRAEPERNGELSSLCEEIVWRLPGIDAVTARKSLQAALNRFCMDSGALVECVRVPADPLGGARAESPWPAIVFRADAHDAFGRTLPSPRICGNGVMLPPGTLGPCGMVEFSLHLMPDQGSEDVPPGFVARHGNAIVHAALSQLLSMKGRPWADEGEARREDRQYHDALAEAVAPDFMRTARPQRAGLW